MQIFIDSRKVHHFAPVPFALDQCPVFCDPFVVYKFNLDDDMADFMQLWRFISVSVGSGFSRIILRFFINSRLTLYRWKCTSNYSIHDN